MRRHPEAPILEFDPDPSALLAPSDRTPQTYVPQAAVACFQPRVLDELRADGAEELMRLPSLISLYRVDWKGKPLAVFYPGQGAPLAAVCLERVIAAGCSRFVACGGAGALVPGMELGSTIVVGAAVRDEGTSYHYLPPGREVAPSPEVIAELGSTAREYGGAQLPVSKVWTTDGFFRETPTRVSRRREEGCVLVDSEAAALLAVAQFRQVKLGYYLYAADDLSGPAWSHRNWTRAVGVHRQVFELAAQAALSLT